MNGTESKESFSVSPFWSVLLPNVLINTDSTAYADNPIPPSKRILTFMH